MDAISRNIRFRLVRVLRSSCRSPVEQLERRLFLSSSAYNWQSVDIPAGGYVDGIFYDPHNQNVMYARTDVGGLYKSTNDGGYWNQLLNWVGGNTSGSGNGTQFQELGVLSFAIDPENSNNLYAMVGLYSGTNGDVLYSTNAGATWSTTPLSFYVGGNEDGRGAGERIAVDPYDSNIILMGSNANGLWESTNAGQSFSQLSSLPTTAAINFVLFDPYGGTAGSPTQEIFVGEQSTASGTNLFETTNGGTSFTEVTGTGSAPTGWMPNRAVLASDGNLYLAYANDQAPTEPSNGGIMRYNTSTGVWANIAPVTPQALNGDDFGYCGIALDPNSSTTLVVTSLGRYNYDDAIWRTTNANASSPSWVALYDDVLYQGYNATRNTTNAPYMASAFFGIGNWASDVAIDPFNSAQIMHNFGGGIWATNDGTSTTTLTAPNSWYFADNGIGMTAILGMAAANGGTPLYSAMGDVGGFAFTTETFSPTQGNIYANGGNGTSIDSAGVAPLDAALVGNMGTTYGFYTTNGITFTPFAANPGGSSPYSQGTVAESANGSTIVWAPSDEGPYYSTNNGASWSASNLVASVSSITQSGGVPTVVTPSANNFAVGQYITITGATPSAYDGTYAIASIVNSTTFTYTDSNVTSSTTTPATGTITASLNGTVVSDKVNPSYFYYWTANSSGSSWTLYVSSNGGVSFTPSAGGAVGTGNVRLLVNPYVAGQLWISSYLGLYESTNFGASFNKIGGYYGINGMALGAPAPGQSVPAIYIYGTPVGDTFEGIYRSDDGGNTWLLLNDVNDQWGGPGALAADPNVFGRVYLGVGGIIIGNPATSLPSGWTDADLNEPGNPGWATSSTTLSTGTTVNEWNIVGGGAGFSSSPISISSLSRSGGVATAVTTTASGLQVGQTITISGASPSAYNGTFVVTGLYNTAAGLANHIGAATEFTFAIASGTDTASGTITATLLDQFNFAADAQTGNSSVIAQLNSLTDAADTAPAAGVMYRASASNPSDPFVALLQNASDQLVFEYRTTSGGSITSTTLSSVAIGSEYVELIRTGNSYSAFYGTDGIHWTQLGSAVTISAIGSTAYAGIAVTAGYNPQLASATFTHVAVDMPPILVNAAAASATTVTAATVNLSALASDADGQSNLTYTWTTTETPPATVTFTPNATNAAQNTVATFTQPGNYSFVVTISNTAGQSVTSTVSVTVNQTAPTVAIVASATPSPVNATSTALYVLGADNGGESGLTYTWTTTGTPPAPVTFSANGTNAAKSTTATFTKAGVYSFLVTITNAGGFSTTSAVSVTVNQTLTSIAVSPASSSVVSEATQQFSATSYDQFGNAMSPQPTFSWSVASGGGSISASGLYTAPSAAGAASITATSGAVSGGSLPVQVSLSSAFNRIGIYADGATFSTGGLDTAGYAFSSALLGSSLTWTNSTFTLGTAGSNDVINATGQLLSLPQGRYTSLKFLATAIWGSQANQTFTVAYTDGSTQIFTQGISDWVSTTTYAGEAVALSMSYRNKSDGTKNAGPWKLYGYSLALNGTKTLQSLILPNNNNVNLLAITVGNSDTAAVTITNAAPTVATAASASPSPVTGATTALSVLGADSDGGGESHLTYTWSTTGTPPAPVNFTPNGTNAAKNTTASFTAAGTYNFLVTITDSGGLSVTSPVTVTVNPPAWLGNGSVAAWNPSAQILTVTGAASIIADPGTDAPIIQAASAAAQITVNPASGMKIQVGGISLTNGARMTITPFSGARSSTNYRIMIVGVTGTPTFTIDSTSTLDLGNGDLIVHNGNLLTISGRIASGFNAAGTYWNGTGINSISARTDATKLTALGLISNNNSNSALYTTFDNQPAVATDVLVKYTYYGDANLDGKVDGSDYQQIDNGFGAHLTGWSNGDFNYDGVVDGSDFSLIDNTFNQITATSASPLATIAATLSADDTNAAGFPIALVTHSKPKFVGTSVALSQKGSLGVFNDGTAIDAWQANSGAGDLIGASSTDFLKELRVRGRRILSPN